MGTIHHDPQTITEVNGHLNSSYSTELLFSANTFFFIYTKTVSKDGIQHASMQLCHSLLCVRLHLFKYIYFISLTHAMLAALRVTKVL